MFKHHRPRRRLSEHLVQQVRVGPAHERGLLRLAHLGSRHHLHRLGDLGGVLDRLDSPAYVARAGHELISTSFADAIRRHALPHETDWPLAWRSRRFYQLSDGLK